MARGQPLFLSMMIGLSTSEYQSSGILDNVLTLKSSLGKAWNKFRSGLNTLSKDTKKSSTGDVGPT